MKDLFATIQEKGLKEKAGRIHEGLVSGLLRYEQVKGKRLISRGRDIVSVPIGWRYRLLYRLTDTGPALLECCTHEEYNKLKKRI